MVKKRQETRKTLLDKTIPARVSSDIYKALAENARQQKVTRTALVRLAVEQYLALNEKPQAA